MNCMPDFFEPIRLRASDRWVQLENDAELAGPWRQLFKQVQSPRHVLSELLQNADDAGATKATVNIENHQFIFTHNGEDFTEKHFASLCRFAYSNKRDLHTIGFRGIGFKSTFSLGDKVELFTPTLSVGFHRDRFTEPRWIDPIITDCTQIRIQIIDERREHEIQKNFQEWLNSPISLLFFKHIRHLKIGEQEVSWKRIKHGPVSGTEWMALNTNSDQQFLLVRSKAEPFPKEAINEISQERFMDKEEESDFPPCKVEIILGLKGDIYVVLPTGLKTTLPFACNAPFIQDPARLRIKDPETSPTNQWLLERIGSLAASVMIEWLEQASANIEERSKAYGFFPDVDREDASLQGVCAGIVKESFKNKIRGKKLLLTNAGDLKPVGQCVIIPDQIFDVWNETQASSLLDGEGRPALSRYVAKLDRKKLTQWKCVDEISKDIFLNILRTTHLPKPSWNCLLNLWAYIAPEITDYRARVDNNKQLCVIPVQGKDVLYSAQEVVRISEKKLLQSEEDWEFLATHLLVLNYNWPRILSNKQRQTEQFQDKKLQVKVDAAYAVLKSIGLEESTKVNTVIEQVAHAFFKMKSIELEKCIRFAQITCKLDAPIGDSFCFVTRDLVFHKIKDNIVFDADGSLETLFPQNWCSGHLLHPNYAKSFESCSRDEWLRWISSGHSGIYLFAPIIQKNISFKGSENIEAALSNRGFFGSLECRYTYDHFFIEDWDFDESHWHHWNELAKDDENFWGNLFIRIINQNAEHWSKAKNARVFEISNNGNKRTITKEPVIPNWILKFRELPCLPDSRGFFRKPPDLLRRTPETESLIDVEPFVDYRLDTEATRPLLQLLGVRDKSIGPEHLLERLRALSRAKHPPIHEVEKWYRRLDQMIQTCSTDDSFEIKNAFYEENLILTEDVEWVQANAVFQFSNEDDVPGAATIRHSVRDLSLWNRIEVAERPTAELAIQWLNTLVSGKMLSQEEAKRVRVLLPRHPIRIWNECGQWLNLSGQWVGTSTLKYALTMQTLVPWKHLHNWIKDQTADFQRLSIEVSNEYPFCNLPSLARAIEDRFHKKPFTANCSGHKAWLNIVGAELARIELDDNVEKCRIRDLATKLAETEWQIAPGLEIIPYIDEIPAGTARRADVVWLENMLYVDNLPKAKLAQIVPDRLSKVFDRPDITAALNYCYERSADDIREYLEENFKLCDVPAPILDKNEVQPSSEVTGENVNDNQSSVIVPLDQEGLEPSNNQNPIITGNSEEEEPLDNHENENDEVENDKNGSQSGQDQKKPKKINIMELFAQSQGFQKDGGGRFFHSNGSWIAKTDSSRFPWEKRSAMGDTIRYYWPKDRCLERESLQLEADVWALIDQSPELYALVLMDSQNNPVEMPGGTLRNLLNKGNLTIYPATYRLVYNNDKL